MTDTPVPPEPLDRLLVHHRKPKGLLAAFLGTPQRRRVVAVKRSAWARAARPPLTTPRFGEAS